MSTVQSPILLEIQATSFSARLAEPPGRVGPELRVTLADGQVIKQMQFDDDKEMAMARLWVFPLSNPWVFRVFRV